MQTNQEALGPLERRVDLAVSLAEIDKDVEVRLRKLARTVKMAGFRPGKVPMKLVAQQYGPQLRSEALGDAVNKAIGQMVHERNLRVAGYPRVEPHAGNDSSQFEFSAVFEVYPEISLAAVSDREIQCPTLEIGDAELEKTIEVLRQQRRTFASVEREAVDGDRVVLDFTGRLDGEIFQGGEASDYQVVLGSAAMLPDFESNLIGLSAGEAKIFDLVFPDDYHAAQLAGKTTRFDVLVKRVEAPHLPEMNADFARALGIADGDIEKMRSEVNANLEREVRKRIRARLKDKVMALLMEANPIDAPKALVEAEAQQMANAARQDMQARGMDSTKLPQIEPSWFTEQANRRVKLGLILAEIVREKQLQAKPEQVRELVDEFAQSYEDPAEVVRWYYAQPQRLGEAEALVIENNVVDWVVANAKAVQQPMPFDELMGTTA